MTLKKIILLHFAIALLALILLCNGCVYYDAIGKNCLAEATYAAKTYQKDTGVKTFVLVYDTCRGYDKCIHAEAFYYELDGSKQFIRPVYQLGPVEKFDLYIDSGKVYNIQYIESQGDNDD